MEKGPDGDGMPQHSWWAKLPTVWTSVANPHLCKYKQISPHVSKARRLLTLVVCCPRLMATLITASTSYAFPGGFLTQMSSGTGHCPRQQWTNIIISLNKERSSFSSTLKF